MPDHGTPECWDEGCRRYECVIAAQQRRDEVQTARIEAIVQPIVDVAVVVAVEAAMPTPEPLTPSAVDDAALLGHDPSDAEQSSGQPIK